MFFAKIPRHTSQNAITEGDLECILTRNCEGTEQLRYFIQNRCVHRKDRRRHESGLHRPDLQIPFRPDPDFRK